MHLIPKPGRRVALHVVAGREAREHPQALVRGSMPEVGDRGAVGNESRRQIALDPRLYLGHGDDLVPTRLNRPAGQVLELHACLDQNAALGHLDPE